MTVKRSVILFTLAIITCCCYTPVTPARILGVFSFAARSHYILGNALMRGLANAGHDVTMISPFEDKEPVSNGSYRNVVLTGFTADFEELLQHFNLFEEDQQSWLAPITLLDKMFSIIDKTFAHPSVQALVASGEKFDILIMEQFMNDALKAFAYHFNASLVILSSTGPNSWVNRIAGNPSPPSYIPHTMSDFSPKMTFFERVGNVFAYLMEHGMDSILLFPKHVKAAKQYFPNAPDLNEIYHDVSVILLNSHESTNQAVPLAPNMIHIGGFHVKPPKKLPKDLQEFLDNAKEGVVYFSMGSNLKSKQMPDERRDMFLKAFGKLKQKVLWKWEDDNLPGQPANVKVAKWLPQQDILAHPNVKLFITHGGLLSTTETVYHGVPILAIPVFADQHVNARSAVRNGYAQSLPYRDPNFSEEKLSELLNELLTNPSYKENVKRRSEIFHDRPQSPMETAVYWVEYALRYKDVPHLKLAGAKLPWYQYFLLDVIAFLTAISISVIIVLVLGLKYCLRRRRSSAASKKLKKS